MSARLGRKVDLALTQYQVGTSQSEAERQQLANARQREEAAAEAGRVSLALALVAGVDETDVLVDRQRRRALVKARQLPGANLSAYRELEERAAAQVTDWTVELIPPARPLPSIAFADGEPDAAGDDAIDLAGWAAKRVGVPLILTGAPAQTDAVAERLRAQGVRVSQVSGAAGPVRITWGSVAE